MLLAMSNHLIYWMSFRIASKIRCETTWLEKPPPERGWRDAGERKMFGERLRREATSG